MKKLIKALLIGMLMLPLIVFAHDPDQISYHFSQEDEAGKLTVHFTPKSALDLLVSLHAEFDENEVIRLADYHTDFTDYFNKTIVLKLNGQDVRLQFVTAVFEEHDASITFNLKGFANSFQKVDLGMSSFTEIYRRTSNHIFLPGHEQVTLNLDVQHYATIDRPEPTTTGSSISWTSGLMLVVIILGLIVGFKGVLVNKKVKMVVE